MSLSAPAAHHAWTCGLARAQAGGRSAPPACAHCRAGVAPLSAHLDGGRRRRARPLARPLLALPAGALEQPLAALGLGPGAARAELPDLGLAGEQHARAPRARVRARAGARPTPAAGSRVFVGLVAARAQGFASMRARGSGRRCMDAVGVQPRCTKPPTGAPMHGCGRDCRPSRMHVCVRVMRTAPLPP